MKVRRLLTSILIVGGVQIANASVYGEEYFYHVAVSRITDEMWGAPIGLSGLYP